MTHSDEPRTSELSAEPPEAGRDREGEGLEAMVSAVTDRIGKLGFNWPDDSLDEERAQASER